MAAFVRLASASQVFCPHLRATLLQHCSLGCPWRHGRRRPAAQFNRRVLRGLRDPSPPQGTRRRGRAAMCGKNGNPNSGQSVHGQPFCTIVKTAPSAGCGHQCLPGQPSNCGAPALETARLPLARASQCCSNCMAAIASKHVQTSIIRPTRHEPTCFDAGLSRVRVSSAMS